MTKREHGIYISALDVAFGMAKTLTIDDGLYDRHRAVGHSISWACGALLYGACRLAERKGDMNVDRFLWNTLRRALVMRMMEASELVADEGLSRSQQIHVEHELWKSAEEDGYEVTKQLDDAVSRAYETSGLMPLLVVLGPLFGTEEARLARLGLHLARLTDDAHSKIIPDFISELGL